MLVFIIDMLDDSYTLREAVICCVEHYLELLEDLKLAKNDFLPRENVIEFFKKKFNILKTSELDSYFSFFDSAGICFLSFWKLHEKFMTEKQLIKSSCEELEESILSGMMYLRDQVIDQSMSISENSHSIVYISNKKYGIENVSGITLGKIHNIMLQIVSNNICNESSSAYWKDVLKQIPQELNRELYLELGEISNAIFKWLKEYLILKNETTSLYTKNTIFTELITAKTETVNQTEIDEEALDLKKSEFTQNFYKKNSFSFKNKKKDQSATENTCHFNFDYTECFESMPWKDQTMFSNFRELQISLQGILEGIMLSSGKVDKKSLKKNELSLRKISHMITELEDYLYKQTDLREKEKEKFEYLEFENKDLKRQLKSTIRDLENQQVEFQDLIIQNNRFEEKFKQLSSQKNKLSLEIVRINEEKKSIEKKYETVLSEFNRLQEKHFILVEEHEQLLSEFNKPNMESLRINLTENLKISMVDAELKNDNSPRLELDFNRNKNLVNNLDIYSYQEEDSSKKSVFQEQLNVRKKKIKELPAIITSIPDFLESKINSTTSLLTKKSSGFPNKKLLERSRTIEVVSPIFEKNS